MQVDKKEINGVLIYTRQWTIGNPIGNIVLVHGYGEHSGRYAETAQVLNEIGYNVYSYDRRGEGQTEGTKAHIEDLDRHVEDFIGFRNTLGSTDLPTYLMAHSLGGLIVVKYVIDYELTDVDGVILSSPFLKVDDNTAPILQKIAKYVAAIAPKLPTVKLDSSLISRDPVEVRKYDNDPLIFHGATNAKTGYELIKSTAYVQSNFEKFDLPLLIIHGTADKLADPKGSKWLYERANTKDKKLVLLDGFYHETMREPEKHLFFEAIVDWLQERK